MSISLRDIEYFLGVAHHGRLSQAANELDVTQPALTKAIQRVEAWFGVPLFERTSRGMSLTSSGIRAMEQLRRLKASYTDTKLLANDMQAHKAGLLRIGITNASGERMIIDALSSLLAQRPALRIQLHHGRSDELSALVQAGELDAAIVPTYTGQPLAGFQTVIRKDPMQLAARKKHPLVKNSNIKISDLSGYGWVLGNPQSSAYRAIEAIFNRYNMPGPNVVLEVSYTSVLSAQILARTDLLSLLPSSVLHLLDMTQFVIIPVAELRLDRTVVLLTRDVNSSPPLVDALRDTLLRMTRK
jgi:DNA-binding transcriptional LysR family regulator